MTIRIRIQPQWTVFSVWTRLPGARDPCPVPEILAHILRPHLLRDLLV